MPWGSTSFAVAVFLGGGTGSLLRYMLALWVAGRFSSPVGTLAANLCATALLAIFTLMTATRLPPGHWAVGLIAIGLCGGFSTFSTFSADTWKLIAAGQPIWAALNVAISLIGCLAVYAAISRF